MKTAAPKFPPRQLWFALLLASLASPVFAQEAADEHLLAARKAANSLLQNVRSEVSAELERTGPIRAITVCKYSAPELTSAISRQTGMKVTRVSLRPRNPSMGEADAWEQKNLLDFEKRLSKGEKVEALEISQTVTEPAGRYFRYMKAIPVGQPCLTCHGPTENIPEGVKAVLANDYPRDRAVNYQAGQIRGAVSIKKYLPN